MAESNVEWGVEDKIPRYCFKENPPFKARSFTFCNVGIRVACFMLNKKLYKNARMVNLHFKIGGNISWK